TRSIRGSTIAPDFLAACEHTGSTRAFAACRSNASGDGENTVRHVARAGDYLLPRVRKCRAARSRFGRPLSGSIGAMARDVGGWFDNLGRVVRTRCAIGLPRLGSEP